MPFFTQGFEGFDINQPVDWQIALEIVRSGEATLPHVGQDPYPLEEHS
jgi:N-acylneuraminate cytidylyltransferase